MGIAKRSLSPGVDHHGDENSEDIMFPPRLVGQMDIRNLCTMHSSRPLNEGHPSKEHRKDASSSSRVEDDVLPLVKLPGQTDIRSFIQYSSDEEAAHTMGLSLGLDNGDEERGEVDTIASEISDTISTLDYWSMALEAAEEAAVSMGLSLGMREDMEDFLQDMAEDIIAVRLQEELEDSNADHTHMYEADEEAAREMGLSLSFDDDDDDANDTGHIDKKPRLEEIPCPAPATPPNPKRGAPKDERETPQTHHYSKKLRVAKELAEMCDFKAKAPSGSEADANGEVIY